MEIVVSGCNSPCSAGPHESLSTWENETAVLDMLIREAIHLCQAYVTFRWNLSPEMYIDSKAIPTGAVVAYAAPPSVVLRSLEI
jgi:sterol 14-demethylase